MSSLPPWANGPFELLVHAEGHLLGGGDFDRRIALISFDNAIEVTITTYLTLHPIQRGNRTYPKTDVEKWLDNFHTKLDFLEKELQARKEAWAVERGHVIWAHEHRNEQYHGGTKGTPEKTVLALVRNAALWVFSLLFSVPDVEARLAQAIIDLSPPSEPKPDDNYDRAIDAVYGMVQVGDQSYYASEVLFSVDPTAYKGIGTRLCDSETAGEGAEGNNP
jgi:hypothetical protein